MMGKSAFRQYSARYWLLLAGGSVVLTATLWLVFDLYQKTVAEEILSGFLKTEAVAIQQGNLLTSVSKNQRMLLSSQFVKGIVLLDCSANPPKQLISLGSENTISKCYKNLNADTTSVFSAGFLKVNSAQTIKGNESLQLVFFVESTFLQILFVSFAIGFLTIFAGIFGFFQNLKKFEMAERTRLLKDAVNGLLDDSMNSKVLDQELPHLKDWIITRKSELKAAQEEIVQARKRDALVDVAKRLAHDIRSPLQTLGIVFEDLKSLPPDKRKMVQLAMNRIYQISRGVVADPSINENTELSKPEKTWIWGLLDKMILEKRTQYQNRDIEFKLTSNRISASSFVLVNPAELSRCISNLLDNSVESIEGHGKIEVSLEASETTLKLLIVDSGKGIPSEVLEKIGSKGFSFKKNGNGLGVFYAEELVNFMGGTFKISSKLEDGTQVLMSLPVVDPPNWFASKIPSTKKLALLDDDFVVLERLSNELKNNSEVHVFSDSKLLRKWIIETGEDFILLSDYDLGEGKVNGLDFILNLDLQKKSVLMTNSYDDIDLQRMVSNAEMQMIPKPLLNMRQFDSLG